MDRRYASTIVGRSTRAAPFPGRPEGGRVSNRTRAAILLALLATALTVWAGAARAQSDPGPCGGKITGAGDPCGDVTGTAVDVVGTPNPALDQDTFKTVVDQVGKNKIGINFTWTLVAGFLVMFMQ